MRTHRILQTALYLKATWTSARYAKDGCVLAALQVLTRLYHAGIVDCIFAKKRLHVVNPMKLARLAKNWNCAQVAFIWRELPARSRPSGGQIQVSYNLFRKNAQTFSNEFINKSPHFPADETLILSYV